MTPADGHVWLDGEQIQRYASKEVAWRIGLLAQNATTPGDITAQELVYGIRISRYLPAGVRKMPMPSPVPCATGHLTGGRVDTLSGGQRQRAWIAMVLARRKRPSCCWMSRQRGFSDISHQI